MLKKMFSQEQSSQSQGRSNKHSRRRRNSENLENLFNTEVMSNPCPQADLRGAHGTEGGEEGSRTPTTPATPGKEKVVETVRSILDSISLAEDKKLDRFLKGLCCVALAWFLLGHSSDILRVLIAFPYPIYRSIKAVLSETKEDDMACLRYWIVFAMFCCVEMVADMLVCLLPLYSLYTGLKLILILWFMAPVQLNGADIVFHKLILPVFREHETRLDELASLATNRASLLLQTTRELDTEVMKQIF